ncbi:2,3-bisphosphoglycerate-independent phosphoglycerate mutase [Patescibacteria group bacterium]|nr:2,3-bisphosphoglycerate-independent phosphoglycerate mutase [Patescibacteria group bacterium]MBU1673437.1 2,3-bisphosphoglycerate-independent phosphoglycerate mutase [Patescibacteria group bacterium]MBU1963362.1 2,3-bisphosphoglycerate-independent phosphoglycerate mutase [Patescibacteria group bacterium]
MLEQNFPVLFLIFDGFGMAPPSRGNAIALANTPNFDNMVRTYPATTLQASGEVVGLPWAEMGNSEVGHLNLGGGKIVYQNLPFINRNISDGSFFTNKQFIAAADHVKKNNSKLHLMGLTSEGGVHSSQNHLYALLEFCKSQGLEDVFIHCFLDGRDTPHNSAINYITQLSDRIKAMGVGKIATLSGRFFAMDRDNRWDRIEKAYAAMTEGKSKYSFQDPMSAIEDSYRRQIFDEELVPTVITEGEKPVTKIEANDAVIFFNYRSDRARQMTKAFVLPGFNKFERPKYLENLAFVTMTEYEKNLPVKIAFEPGKIDIPLAKVISDAGLKQLHIAETEKYAHVTFFFNGGKEDEYPGEERIIIPSPSVSSYDQAPEMSANELTKKIIEEMNKQEFHFIIANYANADMVGHSGNIQAAVKAVEFLDKCLGELLNAILQTSGTLVLTSDHGNCEEMYNLQTGEIMKEHTTNPVPFILAGQRWAQQKAMWPPVPHNELYQLQPSGVLSDVAPTLLSLMGLQAPAEMSSRSLL